MSNLLKVSEVAERLRVSKMTVYRLIEAGEMKSVRIGRSIRISGAAFAEYLRRAEL